MIISLDTETTGVDFAHGAQPFLVTTCDDSGEIKFWEWDVDPLTRKPDIPWVDLIDIADLLDAADQVYLQNAKFDARALMAVGVELPWPKVRDTLVMGHLLASNHGHRLDQMCVEYLGADISQFEEDVKATTQAVRAIAKRDFPHWKLADEGAPGMPSVKASTKRDEDKPWKNDMWLPRALAKHGTNRYPMQHWATVCSAYACADSEHTLHLGLEMERLIRERGLWAIYEHRLRLPKVACEMECCGVTAIGTYTEATIMEHGQHVAEAELELVSIAAEYGHELDLADGASINDNMRDFFYGAVKQSCPRCAYTRRVKHWVGETVKDEPCPKCAKSNRKRSGANYPLVTAKRDNLALPVISTPKVTASLDREAMKEYLATTDGTTHEFLELLLEKRSYDTALTYMEAYRRFWVPCGPDAPGYYRVHPSLNPCATDHLRWASNSPNMQNVSGESKEISNRACFGPLPWREWWSMDFKSIERRIPAYESAEPKMVEVFERPNEAPYWGNLYCLTASVLYPDEYWPRAEVEGLFRKECPKLYKGAKFFDLAKQYGAGRRKGDLLSGVMNSYDIVDSEFPLLAKLQQHYLKFAERNGYVDTLPDRDVDPKRGYPILASRTEDGRILSTTPFNYHVSGTACWCKNTALLRCSDQCAEWRNDPLNPFDARVILEVHDQIIFDFPRGDTFEDHLPRALVLKGLMERSGDSLVPRIPTPVSVEYHDETWARGVSIQ